MHTVNLVPTSKSKCSLKVPGAHKCAEDWRRVSVFGRDACEADRLLVGHKIGSRGC